ncbi:MAG TPA: AAA family ATPase [Kofleriaceae bacterium]
MGVLLERTEPTAALLAQWDAARGGRGAVALVEGEAGIGKTSLVRALLPKLGDRAFVGACDAMSTPRPLGPFVEIAAQLAPGLARLLESGQPTSELCAGLLAELRRPTALVIEDAHWADAATLDVLRYLVRRANTVPALIIVTYRDDEVGPRHPLRVMLGDVASAGAVHRVPLARLSPAAVRTLARGTELDARELHERTGGNPFFVTEAIAARTLDVPATVRDAVLARFARLSDAARAAIEAIATLGHHATAAALGPMLDGGDALEDALASGIVTRTGDTLEFRHELGRVAVLSAIPPDRLRTWHSRALASLSGLPAPDVAALAHHADGAGDAPRARDYALEAARQAARLRSHRESAAQYARAARFVSAADSADRAELLEAWAYESYLIGDQAGAAELRLRAAEMWQRLGDAARHADNIRWLSRVSWFAGRRADADRYAQQALDALAELPPGRELAAAYGNLAQLKMLAQDTPAAIRFGRKAAALARKLGDTEIECHALNNVGTSRILAGDLRGAAEVEKSLAIAKRIGHEEHAARAYTNLSSTLAGEHEVTVARRWFDEGIAYCDEHDLDAWRLYMLGWRALAELLAGELTAAADTAQATLAQPIAPPTRVTPLSVLGRVRARRGEPDVWAPLDEALAIADQIGEIQRVGIARIARAEAAWLEGDLARAKLEAEAVLPLALRVKQRWAAGELLMWAQLAGATPKVPAWIAPPFLSFMRGKHAASAKQWRALGHPFEEALALAAIGTEASLRHAFALVEPLGMPAAAAVFTRRLRELGARNIPRGRRPTTRANASGLTVRELEIADLLVDGLRNAEIAKRLSISAKTVDHHVSAILRKLGLPDRAAVAKWRARAKQLG